MDLTWLALSVGAIAMLIAVISAWSIQTELLTEENCSRWFIAS